jgi:NAD(P)-dependent dehydrogenase (short-subunit alcohol dehydrogenase family)
MNWSTTNMPSQAGRRALVTGANSGIGYHEALELARSGAEIVLPARSEAKSAEAIRRIRAEVPNAKLTPAVLDLASLASIHAFARFYGERFPGQSLDLLINNAGVMALPKRELTVDGFERQFATNFLGPFALTALLFANLKPRPGTRIVSLSSVIAQRGKIDFDNLQSERAYKPMMGAYAQSKLADLMFALELQHRLSAVGSPIVSIGAHPGIATTNLMSSMGPLVATIGGFIAPLIAQDAAHGALPTLFAATSAEAMPGRYYGPDGRGERKGAPAPAKIPDTARDQIVAKRLWAEAERCTGLVFDVGVAHVEPQFRKPPTMATVQSQA